MDSLNVKNINDEKIFNVIDPNGQGEVVNRIRPISISINQKAETINDETESTINLSVYWNDTWKSILDLTFNDSLRQEYGKLVTDLTAIQKDIDMKQYKDAETKTSDFLKYVANLSSKYTAIPETQTVARNKNKFITIKAERNSVKATISDKLLNFMLKKFAKVNDLDYTKANECYRINRNSCIANDIALYFHSPELFQKQAYMTVVKDNKIVGSYKATYDQFCKLASKFDVTPQKLGYSKDKLAGYMKTAEVVMQNIFFDSVDEAKEWQEMVDEKKKEQADIPEGEETETTETTETETKTTMEEGKSESPAKEEGGLARPSEDFASDEIPESEPRQQEQQQGGQMAASRRLNLLKKRALRKKSYTVEENKKVLKELEDMLKNKEQYYSHETIKKLIKEIKREIELQQNANNNKNINKQAIEGDVQEQDIVPAKTETKVYLQSEKAEDFAWLLDGSGFVEILAPKDLIMGATGSGDNSNGVNELRDYIKKDLEKIPTGKIQKIVSGYGIENVKEMDRDELERYLVWLLAGDTADDLENRLADKEEIKNVKAKATKKINKLAGRYKAKVAELLDEINQPDILVDYISEDDAEEICEKCEIPHEASWYKGDLRGHIAEIPDGMVDVLIEYISESDAEHIWRQIQHDMGNDIDSSKKIKVKKQAEEKMEQQVGEDGDVKGVIGVGDIVCIKFDGLSERDFAKYSEFLGMPMLLIENDKEDINKVIIEQVEYPFQRVTINKDNIDLFDNIKEEQVLVEDVDGDEMITTFEELPIVAKQCKIKSIHKAARMTKNKMKRIAQESKWDREEEVTFYGDQLIIDGEWKKCWGKVYVFMETSVENEVRGDGETLTGRTYREIDDYKIDELMDLQIIDDPDRNFTKEELAKILEENRDTFEYDYEMPSLTENMGIKVNESGDEPW